MLCRVRHRPGGFIGRFAALRKRRGTRPERPDQFEVTRSAGAPLAWMHRVSRRLSPRRGTSGVLICSVRTAWCSGALASWRAPLHAPAWPRVPARTRPKPYPSHPGAYADTSATLPKPHGCLCGHVRDLTQATRVPMRNRGAAVRNRIGSAGVAPVPGPNRRGRPRYQATLVGPASLLLATSACMSRYV